MLQKALTAALAATALAGLAGAQDTLAITEVCDGTLTGGQPKWVQLTNTGTTTIPDLSVYRLYNFNNGGNTNSFSANALNPVSLAPGASYVVAYEFASNTACDPAGLVSCFEFVYGSPPDQFIGPFTNGDDMYMLLRGGGVGTSAGGPGDGSDGCIVDVYGEWDTDGTGEPWEYTDGYSFRCGSGPLSVWTACDWFVAGVDSLQDPNGDDTVELGLLQSLTTPFTHVGCAGGPCSPTAYCRDVTPDSALCQGSLSASSTSMPMDDAGDFTITASGVQGGVNGLFFMSLSGAFSNAAFAGGKLCIKAPLGRSGIGNSGGTAGACDGSLSLLLNDPSASWAGFVGPGTDMWVQCFYRDPGAVSGFAVTDAMYVQLQ